MIKKCKSTLYIRGISNVTKNEFRAHCLRRGLTLKEGIILLMESAVEKDKKNALRRIARAGKH